MHNLHLTATWLDASFCLQFADSDRNTGPIGS